jgi:hypothetical protein
MKSPRRSLLLGLFAPLVLAGIARASALDDMKSRLELVTSPVLSNADRMVCVCGANSADRANRAGSVRYLQTAPTSTTLRFAVRCVAPTYNDSDGSIADNDNCSTFTILAK